MRDTRQGTTQRFALAVGLVALGLGAMGCSGEPVQRSAGDEQPKAANDCLKPDAVCPNTDFSLMDLSGLDLSGGDFTRSNFNGANLQGTNFENTVLRGARLGDAACEYRILMMRGECLDDYGWNTLAPPVPIISGSLLGKGDGIPSPTSVVVSEDSRTYYVADSSRKQVLAFDMDQLASADPLEDPPDDFEPFAVVAGSGGDCSGTPASCGDGLAASKIKLSSPSGLALDTDANLLFVADAKANFLWQVDLSSSDGTATVIAGTGRPGKPEQGDGQDALDAPLAGPQGMAWDGERNRLVFADTANNAVRSLSFDDFTISTLAGQGDGAACDWLAASPCGSTGPGVDALLSAPTDVAIDSKGSVFFADSKDAAVRKIDLKGTISSVVAPPSGTKKSQAGDFPEPTFVDVDRDGNLFVGPMNTDGTGVGWLAKKAATKEERLDWDQATSVVKAPVVAGAVAPNLRFLLAADSKTGKLSVAVPQVGPNVKDANFTGADLSEGTGLGGPTTMDGIFQNGAIFDEANLVGVRLENSVFDTQIKDVDLSRAVVDSVSGLNVDNSCLAGMAMAAGTYSNWTAMNSSMEFLWTRKDQGTVRFTNADMTNVNLADADNGGEVRFVEGRLTDTNFSPAQNGKDKEQFAFEGTSLHNTPRNTVTAEQSLPDYTETPKDWDKSKTTEFCNTPVSRAVHELGTAWAPAYDGVDNSEYTIDWSSFLELQPNAESRLAGGKLVQSGEGDDSASEYEYIVRMDRTGMIIAQGPLTAPTDRPALTTDLDQQIKERSQDIGIIRDGDEYSAEILDSGDSKSIFKGSFALDPASSMVVTYKTEGKQECTPEVEIKYDDSKWASVRVRADFVGKGTTEEFTVSEGKVYFENVDDGEIKEISFKNSMKRGDWEFAKLTLPVQSGRGEKAFSLKVDDGIQPKATFKHDEGFTLNVASDPYWSTKVSGSAKSTCWNETYSPVDDASVPEPPTKVGVNAGPSGSGMFKVTWNNPPASAVPILGYRVEKASSFSQKPGTFSPVTKGSCSDMSESGSATSCEAKGLYAGQAWQLRVVAINRNGESEPSAPTPDVFTN